MQLIRNRPRRTRRLVRWPLARVLSVLALLGLFGTGATLADEPSFAFDVMAVLSKAGCNLGACHGNANGKGGFKLSLRGEDPTRDHAALTRDAMQRRVNRFEPEASLILAKPSGKLAHEGGVRFKRDSLEYG